MFSKWIDDTMTFCSTRRFFFSAVVVVENISFYLIKQTFYRSAMKICIIIYKIVFMVKVSDPIIVINFITVETMCRVNYYLVYIISPFSILK